MEGLPDELIKGIVEYLRTDDTTEDQANFCTVAKVCRRLNRISTPLLYQNCVISTEKDPAMVMSDRAYQLLNSIILKPELGGLVRHFRYLHNTQGGNDVVPTDRILDSRLAISEPFAGTLLHQQMCSEIKRGSEDAAIALILCVMPGLQTLELPDLPEIFANRYEDDEEDYIVDDVKIRVIDAALSGLSSHGQALLSNLTTVSLGTFDLIDFESHIPARIISLFLKLPSLKMFRGQSFRDDDEDTTWACDDGVSNVSNIDITNCNLNTDAILRILRSCKALCEFRFDQQCTTCLQARRRTGVGRPTKHELIIPALVGHRATLTRLSLDFATCGHVRNSEDLHHLQSSGVLGNRLHLELNASSFFLDRELTMARNLANLRGRTPETLNSLALHYPDRDRVSENTIGLIRSLFSVTTRLQRVDLCNVRCLSEGKLDATRSRCSKLEICQEDTSNVGEPDYDTVTVTLARAKIPRKRTKAEKRRCAQGRSF